MKSRQASGPSMSDSPSPNEPVVAITRRGFQRTAWGIVGIVLIGGAGIGGFAIGKTSKAGKRATPVSSTESTIASSPTTATAGAGELQSLADSNEVFSIASDA